MLEDDPDPERCPERSDERRANPHCFCQSARLHHTIMNHRCAKCCWCGKEECFQGKVVQKEGHGPLATIVEWPKFSE